uniref:WSC domain-containing protein n=1 Tax=Steinernema glaseri TaxID=37863 RepID=A0A1I7YJU4_9BILA
MTYRKTGLVGSLLTLAALSVVLLFYEDLADLGQLGNDWIIRKSEAFNSLVLQALVRVQRSLAPAPSQLKKSNKPKLPRKPLGCERRKMDPWDESILRFDNPNWKPVCRKNQTQITELKNGRLMLDRTGLPADYTCDGRCLYTASNRTDWNFRAGPWEDIEVFEADCDVVEVRCGTNVTDKIEYNFLHTTIFERRDTPTYGTHGPNDFLEKDGNVQRVASHFEKPNIYILVFDSTSTSSFVRSMSKTFYLMKEQHQGVVFQHLNKVGINSRPNAWALMFGKQIYEVGRNPYTEEILPDLTAKESCDGAVDGEDFWMYRFRDLGYHTMMADDWALGSVNWSNCWGFLRAPAKHYMKPFQRRNEEKKGKQIRQTMKDMCHETFEDTSLYLDQFMTAYKQESQMAYIWNNDLGHGDENGLYHADEHFYRILKQQEERLAETNNLHELFDPESEEFRAGHGSSYFRRRMNEPRDCGTLRIPYEFCLCEKKFEAPIPANSTEAIMMADFVITHFQDMIDNENMADKCQKFSVQYENTVAEKLVLPDNREVYKLKVSVLPSKGIFSGYLEVARNETNDIASLSLMSKRFERVNSYGKEGDCVKKLEDLRPICYCVYQPQDSSDV